ncbi:hypothetical protein GN244_ATG11833 [Phytophthora infestans]|uniref:Uncharacterized protein n=1 Tax=Phytophthora infestans TaxID=4787 RepID=A0A833WI83_PHYIN|nr:hypothetical protein GN244_ATG11833 [Phytophthora infestans]
MLLTPCWTVSFVLMDRAVTPPSDVVSAWSDTSSVASSLDLRLHGSTSEESSVGQSSSSPSRLRLQPMRKAKKSRRPTKVPTPTSLSLNFLGLEAPLRS